MGTAGSAVRARKHGMAVEARRSLVWATAAAAVASALLLTSNGGGLPRLSTDARAVGRAALAPAAAPNGDHAAPAARGRTVTPPRPDAR